MLGSTALFGLVPSPFYLRFRNDGDWQTLDNNHGLIEIENMGPSGITFPEFKWMEGSGPDDRPQKIVQVFRVSYGGPGYSYQSDC